MSDARGVTHAPRLDVIPGQTRDAPAAAWSFVFDWFARSHLPQLDMKAACALTLDGSNDHYGQVKQAKEAIVT